MIDTTGCLGNSIRTKTGYVDLLNPDPDTIFLEDIATSLGKIQRYNGHAPQSYTVAEHCCLAMKLAMEDGCSTEEQVAVLMHDAAEAYVGDMTRPLKNAMPEFRKVEQKILTAIGARFGIDFDKHHSLIKMYDNIMIKAEKQVFWPDDYWPGLEDVQDRVVDFEFYPECIHWFSGMATCRGVK